MVECPHLGQTSAYFDGALAEADEAAAADHLATCAECQGLLRDAATLDAVISTATPAAAAAADASVVPISRHKRWPIFVLSAGLAAAAALAVWLHRPGPAHVVALHLPPQRALEARFTGDHFDLYRPYAPFRGDRAHEPIPLAELAELERYHRTADLIGALAATGDLARAGELAAQRTDLDADTDRAALALSAGHPDAAIELAYRAVDITEANPDPRAAGPAAAWWNLAIAARDLDLPRVSRDAYLRVTKDRDGWADEARRQIAELDRRLPTDRNNILTLRQRAAADQQAGKPGLARAELAEAELIRASSK